MGMPDTIAGARDRAVLTVGFAGALRTSELVGLDIGAIGGGGRGLVAIDGEGAHITLIRSKTDQQGRGISKLLPRGGDPCPVSTLERWLAMADISSGPVFRPFWRWGVPRQQRMGHRGVATIVKKAVYVSALRAGASEVHARARASQVSSHSLRAGFVTSAARAKVASEDIALHVGWVGTQMVAHYMRQLDPAEDNPAHLVLMS
jgi:integrase